jgi:hypothetical protein
VAGAAAQLRALAPAAASGGAASAAASSSVAAAAAFSPSLPAEDAGPVTAALRAGARIKLVLVACNRPQALRKTLDSLAQARGTPTGL